MYTYIHIYIYVYGQSRFLNCGSFSEIKNCKNACVHNVSALFCSKMLLYTTFRLFFVPKCFCTQRLDVCLLQHAFVHHVSAELLLPTRAPRCMGTLRENAERTPRCMGTLFCSPVNRQPGPTGPSDPKGNQMHPKATPKTQKRTAPHPGK